MTFISGVVLGRLYNTLASIFFSMKLNSDLMTKLSEVLLIHEPS